MKRHTRIEIVGLISILLAAMVGGCNRQSGPAPLGRGATMPKLPTKDWLNGRPPAQSDLSGKVLVISVWAHW